MQYPVLSSFVITTEIQKTKQMKKTFLITLTAFLAIAFTFMSCKKDDTPDEPRKNSRSVKYEITGNYTGKLNIVTNSNIGTMDSYNDISIPWTKELTYPNNVIFVGIGGNSSTAGAAGQTVTLKVYSGGNLIYTKIVAAGANGLIGLPTYAFTFQ